MALKDLLKEALPDGLRDRLSALLSIENLDSPQQLADFEDGGYRPLSSWEIYTKSNTTARNRKERYLEYDRMDESSDINAALSAYADETTIKNREKDMSIWAVSDNKALVERINDLFKRVRAEDWIRGLARTMAKYGDDFEQIFYDENGIYNVKFIRPDRIDRMVDDQGRLRGYRVTGVNSSNGSSMSSTQEVATAHPWDFVHFKVEGTSRDGWGESVLQAVMKTFRMLDQLETALALYRLYRAADRLVFYVDVAQATSDQAYGIVEKWRQSFRKRKWYDNNTGQVDFKKNPIDINEDIFWPVRDGSPSKVDRLQGSSNVGDIADIEYQRNKLRFGLGIPSAYFGDSNNSGGGWNSGVSIAQQDMRFARTAERIQRGVIAGFTKMVQIDLACAGQNPDAGRFKLRMEPLSYLSEMQRMEAMQTRIVILQGLVQVGQQLGFDPLAWSEFCIKHVLNLSDDEMQDFFEGQSDNMAASMQQQQAFQQQRQGMQLFNNAKQGAVAAAKRPGGNSGVTVKSGLSAAKSPKSQIQDALSSFSDLVEQLGSDISPSDEQLASIAAWLQRHPEMIEEFNQDYEEITTL